MLLPGRPAFAATGDTGRSFEPALLDRATRRAAGLERLHALIVARQGRVALAEAFRGPPLDRPVNVKSVSKTLVACLAGAAIDRGLLAGKRLLRPGEGKNLAHKERIPGVGHARVYVLEPSILEEETS